MEERIVLVGVGGTGMSGVAHLLLDLGYTNLIGIDSTQSELTDTLQAKGMQIIIGHGSYQGNSRDIVIYSAAAHQSVEVQFALDHRKDDHKHPWLVLNYFEFLGELSKYFTTIAIAWTHGKSTTTWLTAQALSQHHPLFGLSILGAGVTQRWWKNALYAPAHRSALRRLIDHCLGSHRADRYDDTKKYLFVVEACEFNRHFLNLDVDYAIITNIELDHADVYWTLENYMAAFTTFAKNVKKDIYMLTWAIWQETLFSSLIETTEPASLPTSTSTPTLHALSTQQFTFSHLLWSHNHGNASLALALIENLLHEQDPSTAIWVASWVVASLSGFEGLRRRTELLWETPSGAAVYTDYGHHPTELRSTLQWLREKYPNKQVTCIFQPHQARRVMEFWDTFGETLRTCDHLIIYDIYAARENLTDLKKLFTQRHFDDIHTIEDLWQHFAAHCNGTYTWTFENITKTLDNTWPDNVIIVFTAWNLDYLLRTHYTFTHPK